MVALGLLVTEVLPSTAIGKWDAEVPSRLVQYRQQEGVSESKIITMLSATPTIIALTALAAAVIRWKLGRWRESLLVIYAVVGETAIFMATTLFIDRPRPSVPQLDTAPPTSSFPCWRWTRPWSSRARGASGRFRWTPSCSGPAGRRRAPAS